MTKQTPCPVHLLLSNSHQPFMKRKTLLHINVSSYPIKGGTYWYTCKSVEPNTEFPIPHHTFKITGHSSYYAKSDLQNGNQFKVSNLS